MGADALAAPFGFGDGNGHFFIGYWSFFGADAGDFLTRQVQLDEVDTILDEHAYGRANLLRA